MSGARHRGDGGRVEVEPHRTVRAYVRAHVDADDPRPSTDRTVELTLGADDCERLQLALRRFAGDARSRPTMLAATALEVSLQDLVEFLAGTGRSTTVEFDAGDCAVFALALLEDGRDGHRASRRQGLDLLATLAETVPELADVERPT